MQITNKLSIVRLILAGKLALVYEGNMEYDDAFPNAMVMYNPYRVSRRRSVGIQSFYPTCNSSSRNSIRLLLSKQSRPFR